MKGLELAGLGPIARCQARMVDLYKLDPYTSHDRAMDARHMPSNPTEIEQIFSR